MQYIVFICKFLQLKLRFTYLYFNVTAPYICVTGIKKYLKLFAFEVFPSKKKPAGQLLGPPLL